MSLVLARKTGTIPKGRYDFIECYCSAPGCDCRRVVLLVVDDKMKEKAVINFGFDQQGTFAGPYLDGSNPQAPYAPQILEFFVDSLNTSPDWLNRLYRHYRAVRERIDSKPYRGKAFPKPGALVYRITPPPDLASEIEQSLRELSSGRLPALAGAPGRARAAARRDAAKGMGYFVERYVEAGKGSMQLLLNLQDDLRRYLSQHEEAGEELAALLPSLCQRSPQADEQIEAALRVLFEVLDILRLGVESGRADARRQMERLQRALARKVFLENEDVDLSAAVSSILIQSRVAVLPVLREATSRLMASGPARSDLRDLGGEEVMDGISKSLAAMGVTSPFEGMQEMLQLFTLNGPELQIALVAEMIQAENLLLREIAALMVFHHEAEVRLGVSRLIASVDGNKISAETLRRLIVSRNWFPDEIRANVDQGIANARRALVACAPLAKPPTMVVHASSIDGAGAQSFQIVVPEGKGFYSCSILIKEGVGVADAFLAALRNRKELNEFVGMLRREGAFLESSVEYLDLRVCQGLAEGAWVGKVPGYQLVRIAEVLGCDRWKGVPFEAEQELMHLREELRGLNPMLLEDLMRRETLKLSGEFRQNAVFLGSWFEDDDTVDREIEASRGQGKRVTSSAAVRRILDVVMEGRRELWLERLVLTMLWLKSAAKKPTLEWHRFIHIAEAVADKSVPLREIPMMKEIARASYEAYRQRQKEGRR